MVFCMWKEGEQFSDFPAVRIWNCMKFEAVEFDLAVASGVRRRALLTHREPAQRIAERVDAPMAGSAAAPAVAV